VPHCVEGDHPRRVVRHCVECTGWSADMSKTEL
jgi:hypothetical protein